MHARHVAIAVTLLVATPLSGCIGVANMDEFKARVTGDDATPTLEPTPAPNAAPVAAVAANRSEVPVGASIAVDASGSEDPDGRIDEITWIVDGGEAGSGDRLTWSFSTAGEHRIQATVRDDDGATDVASVTVDVVAEDAPPNASMTIVGPDGEATQRVHAGADVTFSAGPSSDPDGDVQAYRWRVAGRNLTGETVTRTFDEAGSYQVRLAVEDRAGNVDRVQRSLAVDVSGSMTGSLTADDPTATLDVPVGAGAAELAVDLEYRSDLPLHDVDLAIDGPGDAGAAEDGDDGTMPGTHQVELAVDDPTEGAWTLQAELETGIEVDYELTWTLRYGLGA